MKKLFKGLIGVALVAQAQAQSMTGAVQDSQLMCVMAAEGAQNFTLTLHKPVVFSAGTDHHISLRGGRIRCTINHAGVIGTPPGTIRHDVYTIPAGTYSFGGANQYWTGASAPPELPNFQCSRSSGGRVVSINMYFMGPANRSFSIGCSYPGHRSDVSGVTVGDFRNAFDARTTGTYGRLRPSFNRVHHNSSESTSEPADRAHAEAARE